jgi:MFS family permease
MVHTNNESDITRANHEPGVANPRRAVYWILTAFGFLVAGLAGGTVLFAWRPDWVWPFPVAGFIGYVLAFRRGMLLWNPNVDRTWRQYLWLDSDSASREEPAADGTDDSPRGANNLCIVRPGPVHPSQHELRVVR